MVVPCNVDATNVAEPFCKPPTAKVQVTTPPPLTSHGAELSKLVLGGHLEPVFKGGHLGGLVVGGRHRIYGLGKAREGLRQRDLGDLVLGGNRTGRAQGAPARAPCALAGERPSPAEPRGKGGVC